MIYAYQDSRPGRNFPTAFECYGTVTPGSPLLPYSAILYENTSDPNHYCSELQTTGNQTGNVEGNSLAQNIANVDILVVELGTNDQFEPLGALGDAANAGTFYGNVRWVVETYLTAKPTIRLVLLTPQANTEATPSVTQQFVNAEVAYANSVGVPVINMFTQGGLNAITSPYLTGDGTHLSVIGATKFYGPVVAQALMQLY